MPYTTRASVEGLIAQVAINSSAKPTPTQVDDIIAGVSSEIDTYLSTRVHILPVVAPDYFVAWLKTLNNYGAAAQILKSAFPSTVGAGEIPAWGFWKSLYDSGIKAILSGDVIPASVEVGATDRIQPATYFTRNPNAEESLGDIAEPWFKRSKVF